jgi:cardiolipin synthase
MTPTRSSLPPDRIVLSLSDRRTTLLEVIRAARREILLSLFRGSDEEIFDELARAHGRGVVVNVLVTARAKGGRKRREKLWKALGRTGATIYPYSDRVVKYHAKYLVVDDGPAVVTSLNLTKKCFARTWDAVAVTYDPEVVSGLRELMGADREERPLTDTLSQRLIIGPEHARERLTQLIENARSSVRVIDSKLSDPGLISLLNRRRADGLTVEVFGAKRIGDLKSHGKIMLIDDKLAVVGSLALAAISLDFRREVALIVDEASAVEEVRQLFGTMAGAGLAIPLGADAAGGAPC